jgi:hypothetical protein
MYNYHKKYFHFFGETALDKNKNLATINGFRIQLIDDAQFTSIARYYSPNYASFMTKAFGEQSSVENEIGVYSQLQLQTSANITITCAHDYFYMPYERYFVKAPTRGNEFHTKFQYTTYSNFSAYYQYSYESKTDDNSQETIEKQTTISTKNFHKFYISIPLHQKIQLKTAVIANKVLASSTKNSGLLVYQDIVIKPTENITFSFRYAQFNAPYEARLYAWEDDVLYGFSSSQYFYEGSSWYGIIKWKINSFIQFQSKVSQTKFTNKYELPETYDLYRNSTKMSYRFLIVITP